VENATLFTDHHGLGFVGKPVAALARVRSFPRSGERSYHDFGVFRQSQAIQVPAKRSARCCAVFLLLVCFHIAAAETKISFRQITKTHPIAVQRGTKAKVKVHSNFPLAKAHSVFFVPAGVKMRYTEKKPAKVKWKDPAELDIGPGYQFEVTVPKKQIPGLYEYRIATQQSVSSVGQLFVTDHPVVIEAKRNNDTKEGAQTVKVPSAICGIIEKFEDVDHYRLRGRQGERWTIQIYAQRVTRAIHCMAIRYPKIHLMDSMLTLYGPNGDIVSENDNFIGGDSLLSCTLSESGQYTLAVRDLRFAGDPRYVYCVEVSRQPQVFGAFPMAVTAKRKATIRFIDSALASADAEYPIPLTQLTSLGWKRIVAPQGRVGAFPLLVSPHRQTAQVEHSDRKTARRLTLPVGVTGRFTKPGGQHTYRFQANKGHYYKFDIHSQRKGFALDSVITIFNSAGKQVQRADDGWFTKDAKCYFRAAKTGEYYVEVRDINRRAGRRFIYHLQAEPSGPDFELHGEFYFGMLSPGGGAIWFARIARLNGFQGPVEIRATNLPRGVTMTPVTIPAGMNHCGLIFSASPTAKINAALVKITGHATFTRPGSKKPVSIVRQAQVTCELRRAGASAFVRCPIRTQLLGVTRPLDLIGVSATPANLKLKRGGSAAIEVRIRRNPKYKDQVLLDTAFSFFSRKYGQQLPPGVSMSSSSQLKLTGDTLVGKIILQANASALPVKRQPIAAIARVPITYSIMTNYASNPIYLTVE